MVMFADSPVNRSALPRHKAENWGEQVFGSNTAGYQSQITFYSRKHGFCIVSDKEQRPAWFSPEQVKHLFNAEVDMLILVGADVQQNIDYVVVVLAQVEQQHLDFGKDKFEFGKDIRRLFLEIPVEEVNMFGLIKAKADWHLDNQFCAKCGSRSVSIEAGAKRRCIKCRTKHYPTMQPTAIMAIQDNQGRFLLCRQKSWPKEMW